jgi:hypothetical protein
LFGPIKYAILPQHLQKNELVAGNAMVEAGTFIAILIGTLLGALLAGVESSKVWITSACLIIAVLGYLSARRVPIANAPDPNLTVVWNPISQTLATLKIAKDQPTVYKAVWAISWFWLYGLLFLSQFPILSKDFLHGSESSVAMLLMFFTAGIAIGSWCCERLSRLAAGMSLFRLTHIGSFGLAVMGLLFALIVGWFSSREIIINAALPLISPWMLLHDPTVIVFVLILAILGFFGGFYCVPLYTLMQTQSQERTRARVISANNILNAWLMVLGALISSVILSTGLGLVGLFVLAGLCQLAYSVYLVKRFQ